MKKTAVIYNSKYGFTKTYAQWIAKDLCADLFNAKNILPSDLKNYDVIIYGGGLYAGSIRGISLLKKKENLLKDKYLYLFTVGIASVNEPENIRKSLNHVLSPDILQSLKIYYLRGGMQYSQMNLLHRIMMRMLIQVLRKKPESELQGDNAEMIRTYGHDIDFTDRQSILPLVSDVRADVSYCTKDSNTNVTLEGN